MDGFRVYYTRMALYLMLSLTALLAGCSDNRDEILGLSVIDQPPPPVVALAPTVTAVVPHNEASGVAINIKAITAEFSEAVEEFGDGASFVVTCDAPCSSPTGSVSMDLTNRVASFTLSSDLEPLKDYTATIDGATSLASGTEMSQPFLWSFTTAATADTTRPRVTVTKPVTADPYTDATAGPAINAAITATFTESMDQATIVDPATSFTVTDVTGGGNTAIDGTVTYIVSSKTARFKPDFDLVAGNTYTATIAGTGVAPVTDLAGNALAGNTTALPAASDYVWNFIPTAIDVTSPTITFTSPADGEFDIALNSAVNATFDEDMDEATIDNASFTLEQTATPGVFENGGVFYDPLSNIATFTPADNLAASTQYTATVTIAATDLAGNALAAGIVPNPWIFTTGTGLAPGAVPLGLASTFGIMATGSTVSTGDSLVNGDVALNPGSSQGIPPEQVNGSIHVQDQVAIDAQSALLDAYNYAWAQATDFVMTPGADQGASYPFTGPLVGGTGGMAPGVYESPSTMLINTPLTLNAGGNVNAVWIFKIGSSLTTYIGTPGGNILLANGAQAKNIFFVPFAAATIGINTTFNGSILAGGDVTGQTGATINGRLLAGASGSGVLTLDSTTVNVPAP